MFTYSHNIKFTRHNRQDIVLNRRYTALNQPKIDILAVWLIKLYSIKNEVQLANSKRQHLIAFFITKLLYTYGAIHERVVSSLRLFKQENLKIAYIKSNNFIIFNTSTQFWVRAPILEIILVTLKSNLKSCDQLGITRISGASDFKFILKCHIGSTQNSTQNSSIEWAEILYTLVWDNSESIFIKTFISYNSSTLKYINLKIYKL